jgi:hypothetical protein
MRRSYLLAAVAAAVIAGQGMAHAQGTKGPAGDNPDRICVYDSGANPPIGWRIVPAGTAASLPRGVATEGQDTQLNASGGCDTDSGTPVPVPPTAVPQATPTATVATPVAAVTATPVPAATDTPTAMPTDVATATPAVTPAATDTPEPGATPWPATEPTMPAGPLPACYPGGPEPCGGK